MATKRCNSKSKGIKESISNESNNKGEFFNFPYLAAFVSLKKNRFISKANFSDGLEIDS